MAGNVATLSEQDQVRSSTRAKQWLRLRGGAGFYGMALLLTVFFFGPFLWTVLSSLKSPQEIVTFPPTFLPEEWRWQNYSRAWNMVPFATFYLNSIIVCVLAVVGQVISATLVAFGFARFRFPGRNMLFTLVLATLIVPWEVTIVPSFLLWKQFGQLDTLVPLWLPAWFGGGAFYIFLLRQFFLTLPREFDEAAKIDGASSIQTLWLVLLPLMRPAMTTVAILSFLQHWQEFIQPLIYLNTPTNFTVSLGLRYFQTAPTDGSEPKEHLLMAGTIIAAIPCIILFFAAQRYFVRGIVMSGIKG
ncbi:MAG: carbohydrate ABC transporter permease [Chloroflexi bacterium]|nr:carbohydrate ABC transporter permease [Chloroflexota bacterium]